MDNVTAIIERLLESRPCFEGQKWLNTTKRFNDMRDEGAELTVMDLWARVPVPQWRLWGAVRLYPEQCRQVVDRLLMQEIGFAVKSPPPQQAGQDICQYVWNAGEEEHKRVADGKGDPLIVKILSQLYSAANSLVEEGDMDTALMRIGNAVGLRLYGLDAEDGGFINGMITEADELVCTEIGKALFGEQWGETKAA